jgi:hypothetical protein
MDQSITINSKAFVKTEAPTPTSVVFTTTSRGAMLPDKLRISHQRVKNKVDSKVLDQRTLASISRTYTPDSGLSYQTIEAELRLKIPSNADSTNVDAAIADLTDFMASAITLRAANIASLKNGEVA